jgi:hypothetical protein
MAVHVREPHRGSFANGQTTAARGRGVPGRFSLGQERNPPSAATLRGWFAEGQARSHPAAAPRGRFCTGQERRRPAAPAHPAGG